MAIVYTKSGDYYLPDVRLRDPPNPKSLTKYGIMRRSYLQKNRPVTYVRLLLTDELFPHLYGGQSEAEELHEQLTERLTECEQPPDRTSKPLELEAGILAHFADKIVSLN
jgi:hypothetical protein